MDKTSERGFAVSANSMQRMRYSDLDDEKAP